MDRPRGMTSKFWQITVLLFVGSVLGSLLLVYFRLSYPIEPENGSWHGLLIVLYSVLIAEAIYHWIVNKSISYRKVFLGIFVLANLGAVPGRIVAAMNQMNSEEAFVLHFQGVFGSLYGMAMLVFCILIWQRL